MDHILCCAFLYVKRVPDISDELYHTNVNCKMSTYHILPSVLSLFASITLKNDYPFPQVRHCELENWPPCMENLEKYAGPPGFIPQ